MHEENKWRNSEQSQQNIHCANYVRALGARIRYLELILWTPAVRADLLRRPLKF